jgi:two-component system NtrC family sensor kinase
VKIGTRLALVLLLALTPVVALFTYFNLRLSSQVYIQNLERGTRAVSRGLRAALYTDARSNEWGKVSAVLEEVRRQGIEAAVFKLDGSIWFKLPFFPDSLLLPPSAIIGVNDNHLLEITRNVSGRSWFCRVVPLDVANRAPIGYLLVAEDLTDVREESDRRAAYSLVAAFVVLALATSIIVLATRRYVSRPLAELSRRVLQFSANDEPERTTGLDEVESLTEEFRRLDRELTSARERLLREHRRQLELERNLRHTDKLATIGTLASGLAHEIGSPMAVIRGRAEYLLHNKPGAQKLAESLTIIINQIDRISGIVHLLLDYARRREPQRVSCDIRPIINRALGLLETEAERRNVAIVNELGPIPLIVDCDADQLQQVFVNLGMNALDAQVEQGGGILRVSTEIRALPNEDEPKLRVIVEDSGPGVPEEARSQIFDPFFTTKPPGKGTGMGLAVSQSILQDHNGEITVEPGVTGGARFVVNLPLAGRGVQQHRMASWTHL